MPRRARAARPSPPRSIGSKPRATARFWAKDVDGVDAAHRHGHAGHTHRVPQRFLRSDDTGLHRLSRAPHALHPEDRHAALCGDGNDVLLEAPVAVAPSKQFSGISHRESKRETHAREHRQVDVGVLVTRKTDEAHLPLLLRLLERLDDAVLREVQRGIVVL